MMDTLVGNEHIQSYLKQSLKKGKIAGSYLFSGPPGVGKLSFAQAFAKEVLCIDDDEGQHRKKIEKGQHPDYHVYCLEGKGALHSIDGLRQLIHEIHHPPYEASKKVFIIQDAHRMLSTSSNALLKTFEEPSMDSVIILVTSYPEKVLETVSSRAYRLFFRAISEEKIASFLHVKKSITLEEARNVAKKSQGSLECALSLLSHKKELVHEEVLSILEQGKLPYCELVKRLKRIQDLYENLKKSWEKEFTTSYLGPNQEMSALEKDAFEKQLEGFIAKKMQDSIENVLEACFFWWRDLFILQKGISVEYLFYPERKKNLEKVLQSYAPVSLVKVFKELSCVRLAFERSTRLATSLEYLFFQAFSFVS